MKLAAIAQWKAEAEKWIYETGLRTDEEVVMELLNACNDDQVV